MTSNVKLIYIYIIDSSHHTAHHKNTSRHIIRVKIERYVVKRTIEDGLVSTYVYLLLYIYIYIFIYLYIYLYIYIYIFIGPSERKRFLQG